MEQLTDFETKLIRLLAQMQARYDALEYVVELIAINHGSTREKFQASLQKARAKALQNRLERMEDVDSLQAALIDDRPLPMNLDPGLPGGH
jgi:hypothetical protein